MTRQPVPAGATHFTKWGMAPRPSLVRAARVWSKADLDNWFNFASGGVRFDVVPVRRKYSGLQQQRFGQLHSNGSVQRFGNAKSLRAARGVGGMHRVLAFGLNTVTSGSTAYQYSSATATQNGNSAGTYSLRQTGSSSATAFASNTASNFLRGARGESIAIRRHRVRPCISTATAPLMTRTARQRVRRSISCLRPRPRRLGQAQHRVHLTVRTVRPALPTPRH